MPELDITTLLRREIAAPIGRIAAAAILSGGRGVGRRGLRVFGLYALVLLLDGSGAYRDSTGPPRPLSAGDCVLVFPDVPHGYGPGRGEKWSELYVVFDGPVFDLWRSAGVLDPRSPIVRAEPLEDWRRRIEDLLAQGIDPAAKVAGFAALLAEIAQPSRDLNGPSEERIDWFEAACRTLETELGSALPLRAAAQAAGLSYEVFRKRFAARAGVSPARYRAERRIAAAREILAHTDLPVKQIAAHLGFSNEFNFSRRFREIAGVSPRAYRRSAGDVG